MPTGLKRDLGLPATTAIAIGAMVGSGVFILPGIAYVTAGGPSVVAAFLVSALLVVPAALSAAEMATAMPEDGGSYVYVERGMGPLLGTIAGIGNWFMLSFKGALALVGGVPYLTYITVEFGVLTADQVGRIVVPLALAGALFFTLLNVVSTSSTGKLQFLIVGVMLVVMGYFIVNGATAITPERTQGAFDVGGDGFLAATALVFISYAGVIKIAAVAEEVRNPGRVIPRAMLGSLAITTALYVAVVYVAVGIVDIEARIEEGLLQADGEGAIMAIAADQALGPVGVAAVVLAAFLALASTANAGLLSASRFPFAMARDDLAPARFAGINDRFNTPTLAVAVTGGMMMVMIAFLPIDQVAKFGSAFQIIVFVLVNLALIGFREGAVSGYDPSFVSPLYPWMQLFGMIGGLVVLTQVGSIAFLGAVTITAAAIGYYYVYARHRVDREGAAGSAVRRNLGEAAVARTQELFDSNETYDVLVGTTEETTPEARRDMLRMAVDLGRLRTTVVSAVEFLDVPHRVFAEDHPDVHDRDPPEWFSGDPGEDMDDRNPDDRPSWLLTNAVGDMGPKTDPGNVAHQRAPRTAEIDFRSIDSENHNRAMVDFASYEAFDLLVTERSRTAFHRRIFGGETDWLLQNAPCDVMLVEDRGLDDIDEIAVTTARDTYDPLKLLVADAIAEETGAELNLIQVIPSDPPRTRRETVEDYHAQLISICTVPTRSTVVQADDETAGLARFVGNADLLITGIERTGFPARLLGRPSDRLVESVDCTAVMVHPHEEDHRGGLIRYVLMEHVFSS